MKFHRIGIALTTMALSSTLFTQGGMVFAKSIPASLIKREIAIEGQPIFHPFSFVLHGATYMPVAYVMQALDKLSITNHWNGLQKGWTITGSFATVKPVTTHRYTPIYVNDVLVSDVPSVVIKDPVSGIRTTYMPIYYVMHVLKYLAIKSTWKNGVWDLLKVQTGPTSAPLSGTTSTSNGDSQSNTAEPTIIYNATARVIDGQNVPSLTSPNAALDDAYMWKRASKDLYVSAQTNDPSSSSQGTSLLSVEPSQKLYLFAYNNVANVKPSLTTWTVNSPDAQILPSASTWVMGQYDTSKADFVAQKPGIYTVQAKNGNEYSVPLVIIVGFSQLISQPFHVPQTLSGVTKLSTQLTTPSTITASHVTFTPYDAVGDWIPIKGSTSLPISSITVAVQSTTNTMNSWDYRLPVVDGQFSGEVRSPFAGKVQVTLFPQYLQTLTKAADTNATQYPVPNSFYDVTVSAQTPDALQTALLASSQGDYTMSTRFSDVASSLLENSPSIFTAIAAVSNYVSESLVYNTTEAEINAQGFSPNYRYVDNLSSWQSGTGICQDYATLTASLLQSIGVPVQTLGGFANDTWSTPPVKDANAAADAHAWLQAYTGSTWMVLDPTWNNDSQGTVDTGITSEFTTDTTSLAATHLLDPTQTNVPI